MDYFTELLESYNKLKKRTFKLEYISEADAKAKPKSKKTPKKKEKEEEVGAHEKMEPGVTAEEAASRAIGSAPTVQGQTTFKKNIGNIVIDAAGKATTMRIYRSGATGDVVVKPLYVGTNVANGTVAATPGDWPKKSTVDPADIQRHYSAFLERLTHDEDGKVKPDALETEAERQQAEQQELKMFLDRMQRLIGGAQITKLRDQKRKAGMDAFQAMREAEDEWKADQAEGGPHDLLTQTEAKNYRQQVLMLEKICASVQRTGTEAEKKEWEKICANTVGYVAGAARQSMEYQLSRGIEERFEVVEFEDAQGNPQVTKVSTVDTLNQGNSLRAVEGNTFLLSFLQFEGTDEEREERCRQLAQKIGLHGKGTSKNPQKIVFYGTQNYPKDAGPLAGLPVHGTVVKPNAVQQLAIKKAQEDCQIEGGTLQNVIDITASTNEKNAIKGTIYEAVPQVALYFGKLADPNLTDKEREEAKKEASEFIHTSITVDKIPQLLQIMQDAEDAGSMTAEMLIDAQEAAEQYGIATDRGKLMHWLIAEAKLMRQWSGPDMFGARFVYHSGLKPLTGGRGDNTLIFTDRKKAEQAALDNGFEYNDDKHNTTRKALEAGATEKERAWVKKQLDKMKDDVGEDGVIYTVRFGQKKISNENDRTKAGELNKQDTNTAYMHEDASNESVEPGFFDTVAEAQGFNPTEPVLDDKGEPVYETDEEGNEVPARIVDPDLQGVMDYYDSVEDQLASIEVLEEPVVYQDPEGGEAKIRTPEKSLDLLADTVKDKLDYDAIKHTEFANLFFDEKGNNRDFKDKLVRERAAEYLKRRQRFRLYREDYEQTDDPQKKLRAEQCLVRTMLISGSVAYDMAQVKGSDSPDITYWSHNSPLAAVAKASREGKLRIQFSPEGMGVSFFIGEKRLMGLSQEGTWSGTESSDPKKDTRARQTRTIAKFDPRDIKERSNALKAKRTPQSVNSSTLYQFMIGQQKLLEDLLTPTSMSQLL